MRTRPNLSVAVIYPTSVPWMARCMDGIRRYAREHGKWYLFCSPPTLRGAEESALTLHSLRGWKGDGVIAATNDASELRLARRMGMPVVNLAAGSPRSHGVPRVMVNHYKAGRLAAEHLISRGLRKLAFFGWTDLWYSEQRCAGFCERAAESGLKCNLLLRAAKAEQSLTWQRRVGRVAQWLATLPNSTGIFAAHDYRAQLIIESCHYAGLRIPEDVGVIGMDNDETVCEHCTPTLTSVSRNSEKVGWEAANLLNRLMQGERPPENDVLVDPDRVVERQSTNRVYCEDAVAQRALDYMRAHLGAEFNIAQLAERLGVSKRTLEMRFRIGLNASPHEFLTRLRLEHAQTLLRMQPKRTAEQIARESGLGTARSLYKICRRITGESVASFRKGILR